MNIFLSFILYLSFHIHVNLLLLFCPFIPSFPFETLFIFLGTCSWTLETHPLFIYVLFFFILPYTLNLKKTLHFYESLYYFCQLFSFLKKSLHIQIYYSFYFILSILNVFTFFIVLYMNGQLKQD